MLGNFVSFFVVYVFFLKINFFKKKIQKYGYSVKQFGSRSGPAFCRLDLGPSCLQKLSAGDTSRQRVSHISEVENLFLSYGVTSWSDIMLCIKIDKPLVVTDLVTLWNVGHSNFAYIVSKS